MKTLAFFTAIVIGAVICRGQVDSQKGFLMSLVAQERAFAKTSIEKGTRLAFLEFFADDGIAFRPHPVIYKEAMKNAPPQANPLAVTLNWEPIFADVSEAGDLGYTTGPYTLADNTEKKELTQHGYYFTIWKKQADGIWKVALDLGIQEQEPFKGSREVRSAPPVPRKASIISKGQGEESRLLTAVDLEFAQRALKDGTTSAYLAYLSADARLYRRGLQPIVGIDSVRKYLEKEYLVLTWEPKAACVAQSADLGYTYGNYEARELDIQKSVREKGYYVRVWKRDAENSWKVVFENAVVLPSEAPKAKQ